MQHYSTIAEGAIKFAIYLALGDQAVRDAAIAEAHAAGLLSAPVETFATDLAAIIAKHRGGANANGH